MSRRSQQKTHMQHVKLSKRFQRDPHRESTKQEITRFATFMENYDYPLNTVWEIIFSSTGFWQGFVDGGITIISRTSKKKVARRNYDTPTLALVCLGRLACTTRSFRYSVHTDFPWETVCRQISRIEQDHRRKMLQGHFIRRIFHIDVPNGYFVSALAWILWCKAKEKHGGARGKNCFTQVCLCLASLGVLFFIVTIVHGL